MLLLFKINFEIPGDGEFQSGQIEFYCFNQRHQGEMWAAEVYGWKEHHLISLQRIELSVSPFRSLLGQVLFTLRFVGVIIFLHYFLNTI